MRSKKIKNNSLKRFSRNKNIKRNSKKKRGGSWVTAAGRSWGKKKKKKMPSYDYSAGRPTGGKNSYQNQDYIKRMADLSRSWRAYSPSTIPSEPVPNSWRQQVPNRAIWE